MQIAVNELLRIVKCPVIIVINLCHTVEFQIEHLVICTTVATVCE